MRVTIDQAFRDRLEKARSIASHEIRDGDLRKILFVALGDFIDKREKRKGLAKPERPRKPAPPRLPTPGKRAPISAETARAVYERDGYCCAFVGADGKRCGSTWQLELHHREPAPLTGSSRPEDLEVRCRPQPAAQRLRSEARLREGVHRAGHPPEPPPRPPQQHPDE